LLQDHLASVRPVKMTIKFVQTMEAEQASGSDQWRPYDGEGRILVAKFEDLDGKVIIGTHLLVVLEMDAICEVCERELVFSCTVAVHKYDLTLTLRAQSMHRRRN